MPICARRLLAAAALAAGGVCLPAAPARAADAFKADTTVAVSAHPLTPQNAPADEYFGKLKLSNVGIRNIIHALAVEGDSPLALPMERTRIMGVQTAIVQWSDKYPRDPWLRRALLTFAQVLVTKHDAETDGIAIGMLLRAEQQFNDAAYDRTVDARLRAITPTLDVDWSVPSTDPPTFADALEIRLKP